MNNLLPQIQSPIDSKDLENQISSQYGVSSDIASILVKLLMLYPEYKVKIKSNQPNQNQQQQQQPQPNNNNNNNDSMLSSHRTKPTTMNTNNTNNTNTETSTPASSTSDQTDQQSQQQSNNLGKTGFANYRSMNSCLSDQTLNHGLSNEAAISTCTKMMQMHLKNQYQTTTHQPDSINTVQQKAASVTNNNYKDMSWRELREIIIKGVH